MDGSLPPAARAYVLLLAAVALAGTGALVAAAGAPGPTAAGIAAALACVLAVTYRHPLSFAPHTHQYLDTAVLLAAALLLAPGWAGLVGAAGVVLATRPRTSPWTERAFNAAQAALQAIAAGGVLAASGWWDREHPFAGAGFVAAVPLAVVAMYAVNTAAVAGAVALQEGSGFAAVWRRVAVLDRTEALAYLAQVALGLLAVVVADARTWALVLLLSPGAVVYSALGRHARLRLRAEDRLVHQAYHDALTGLPNRALFLDRLDRALARAGDRTGTVAVLFLDLDRFKLVNDTLGHEAGDRLLVEVAGRLQATVREGDIVARFGGDEFTVLMEDVAIPAEPRRVAGRIAAALSAPIDLGPRAVVASGSVGIVVRGPAHRAPADMLRDADVALYQAKDAGRARAVLYVTEMGDATRARAALEDDLRRAIGRGEFRLLYQPQVDLATGRVAGVEALVRWSHPDRGLLEPAAFLAVAEETGLIVPLGAWVLDEACRQARDWRDRLGFATVVGVNLSPRQLAEPGLADEVGRALEKADWPPALLCLEVAEAIAFAEGDGAGALRALRGLGVAVAMDDFGVGASRLAQLGRLPVDTLKLDGSLVAACDRSPEAAAVVRAVVGLAHGLGLAVVAEGLETADEAALLQTVGCDAAQGRYLAPPLTPAALEQWLAERAGSASPAATLLPFVAVPS